MQTLADGTTPIWCVEATDKDGGIYLDFVGLSGFSGPKITLTPELARSTIQVLQSVLDGKPFATSEKD